MWDENRKLLDDIHRCMVCSCGNYRHHGVDWMPEGSGEGLSDALKLVDAFAAKIRAERETPKPWGRWHNLRHYLALNKCKWEIKPHPKTGVRWLWGTCLECGEIFDQF